MAILLAALSTISIGVGEFVAGALTQRARANEVTSAVFLGGVAMMVVVAGLWPGQPTSSDMAYGAAAGIANGVAILLLYIAYSRGSLRVAAPASAVVMSAVPVGWDIAVAGVRPSTLTAVGLAVGVVSIAASSYERSGSDRGSSGLAVAIVAGLVFGALFVLLDYIGQDAGGTPVLAQRIVGFLVAVAVTRATGPRIFPAQRRDFLVSFGVGMLATTAVLLIVLALHRGNLAVVGVVSSQYAAVAVLLGVVFRGQRMWWWQTLGLAGASIAVALIALG